MTSIRGSLSHPSIPVTPNHARPGGEAKLVSTLATVAYELAIIRHGGASPLTTHANPRTDSAIRVA